MFEFFNIDMAFNRLDLRVVIPVIGTLLGFMVFWFTQKSDKLKEQYREKYGEDRGSANFIMFTRYLGAFSMGVLPASIFFIVFPETTFLKLGMGVYTETLISTIVWIVGLSIVIIPIVYFSAKKSENLTNYPQIRSRVWNRKMVLGNLASWAVYLLGYEFLFRGLLLFPLVEELGLWPAVAINIALYSGTHIPKGLSETTGAIPLSIVLCLLSVNTGTIWIAYFVHLVMAWTNTTVALKYNSEMQFVNR
ncbi:MAG: CPBP family intramembrane glutamic endopeptidase [Bacteroidota bacterium]